jgi:hypothetical protein
MYTIKHDGEGNIVHYKAHCVIRGERLIPGIHFGNTYSPCARMVTIQILFSITTQNNWTVQHADVPNAYLNGSLNHLIVTHLPEGWNDACGDSLGKDSDLVILLKALYGTPDAGCHWNHIIHDILISISLSTCPNKPCMYMYKDSNGIFTLILWVDDIFYTGNHEPFHSHIISSLITLLNIKTLSPLTFALGISFSKSQHKYMLSQSAYIDKLTI